MPLRRRRVFRKRRAARRPLRRRGGLRKGVFRRSARSLIAKPTSQYGTVTETITLPDLSGNAPYQYDLNLSQFPRSVAVTALYQFYRLKYVEFKYIPKYPMGTQAAPGAQAGDYAYGRPMRFFYMMNRLGTEPLTSSLEVFEKKGCKPIPFGDSRGKAVIVKYKPNLMSAVQSIGPQNPGINSTQTTITPVFNRWINRWATDYSGSPSPQYDVDNTNNDYEGHLVWIDDFNLSTLSPPNDEQIVSEVRVTAVWEYKTPYEAVTEQTQLQNGKIVTKY